ncbi:hypothetical protein NDU88_001527 [Pleurodeles waltl]|uniref:Uncharacterized protein n=1 Tax=Pleurodeles waltl TaxID=8319 RepID=A0AAV7VWQ5_PLEWA|nr:hypothetical protein NDU88_001527 [Pleurodeles waltl]
MDCGQERELPEMVGRSQRACGVGSGDWRAGGPLNGAAGSPLSADSAASAGHRLSEDGDAGVAPARSVEPWETLQIPVKVSGDRPPQEQLNSERGGGAENSRALCAPPVLEEDDGGPPRRAGLPLYNIAAKPQAPTPWTHGS